jgi:hypothetical protein
MLLWTWPGGCPTARRRAAVVRRALCQRPRWLPMRCDCSSRPDRTARRCWASWLWPTVRFCCASKARPPTRPASTCCRPTSRCAPLSPAQASSNILQSQWWRAPRSPQFTVVPKPPPPPTSLVVVVEPARTVFDKRRRLTELTMSSTDAIAPVPMSPHASTFEIGGITWMPSERNVFSCCSVNGCVHISVFIAGATSKRLRKVPGARDARQQVVALTVCILAKVLALNGAISMACAHFLNCQQRAAAT